MKVRYDISVLGGGVANERARTGIFRVVEQVALQLAVRPEVELEFHSKVYPRYSLRYLETSQALGRVPLQYSRPLLKLDELKIDLGRRCKESGFPLNKGYKAARELVHGSQKLLKLLQGREANNILKGCDIFHSPFYPLPQGGKKGLKFITVYDLIPILFPQYFQYQEDHLLHKVMQSIDRDTWVFCISEATKNDLLNHNRQVDPDKVAVIPLGASPMFRPCEDHAQRERVRQKYGIPDRPYFLSVSTLEPRKNIDSTIRAFMKVVQQERLDEVNLVLVGAKGWDFGKIFDEIAGSSNLKERIFVTGYAADEDLSPLYSGALAFVYPSFYEGFGLPPLEAMQCGTPVITSNTSSLPEVVGEAGIQVSPKDQDALCQAMLKLFQDEPLRKELSAASRERARLFSWEACVDTTIEHYRRALAQTGHKVA